MTTSKRFVLPFGLTEGEDENIHSIEVWIRTCSVVERLYHIPSIIPSLAAWLCTRMRLGTTNSLQQLPFCHYLKLPTVLPWHSKSIIASTSIQSANKRPISSPTQQGEDKNHCHHSLSSSS